MSESHTRANFRDKLAEQRDATRGTILSLAAALCGGIIGATVAISKAYLTVPDLLFFRFFLMTILLGFVCRKSLGMLFQRDALLVWFLGFSGAVAASCYYWTLQNMNVGTAMLLNNTSLLYVVFFAWLFMREALSAKSLLGVILMFLSVCLVNLDRTSAPTILQLSVGLLGAIALATSTTCVRATAKRYPPLLIVFVFGLCSSVVAPTLPNFTWAVPSSFSAWGCIVVTLIAGLGANFLFTVAMQYLQAGIIGDLTKTAMIWALLLMFFYNGSVPSVYEFGAYSLTLLAVFLLQRIKARRKAFCCIAQTNINWKAENFKERAGIELPKLIQGFENVTSCELKFHLDNTFDGDLDSKVEGLFDSLGLHDTELRNGVLIAFFVKPSKAVIYFDSGLSTQISHKDLRGWSEGLLELDGEREFISELEPKVLEFAKRLSADFPIAIDDINELSDEVSIVWE